MDTILHGLLNTAERELRAEAQAGTRLIESERPQPHFSRHENEADTELLNMFHKAPEETFGAMVEASCELARQVHQLRRRVQQLEEQREPKEIREGSLDHG